MLRLNIKELPKQELEAIIIPQAGIDEASKIVASATAPITFDDDPQKTVHTEYEHSYAATYSGCI